MATVADLSQAQCVLLAVHYASSANIAALHSFTPSRLDVLDPELVLRIILTYLPGSTEPREYTSYVGEVASRLYLDHDRQDVSVDVSHVTNLSAKEAERQVKKLKLLEIAAPLYPKDAPPDLLTKFLCHRAYRIDQETGLLSLIPQLIESHLDRNEYTRTWYTSVVLPVLRLECEYYPEIERDDGLTMASFEALDGKDGVDLLMRKCTESAAEHNRDRSYSAGSTGMANGGKRSYTIVRDARGLIGPWMCGHTERKRRKLDRPTHIPDIDDKSTEVDKIALRVRKISLSGISTADRTGHDWEFFYAWLVQHARAEFALVAACIEDWDGPGDVDVGDVHMKTYMAEDEQRKLELQYAQAAFATCYACTADTLDTVESAHAILARLAELLDFVPPPELASTVESLPKVEKHASSLDHSQTADEYLAPENLLKPEHPLTTPRLESYMLLQMMVYSAYQLNGLSMPMSLGAVARLHFYATSADQLALLRKMLKSISQGGRRRDESQWAAERARLMWLWNWGMDSEQQAEHETEGTGVGVLGKIERTVFEEEMLKCFIDTSSYTQAIKVYLQGSQSTPVLSKQRVQDTIMAKAMEAYDGASNGNRTRGGTRKAADILSAFRPYFSEAPSFREADSLLAATHALSFYTLTLQHGVPFKPVSIRVSQDPIGLLEKVLEQNTNSYTKLDDLVAIGKSLAGAGLPRTTGGEQTTRDSDQLKTRQAERRVTFMAVQAALREDDFETAYSYVVNRLTPSGSDIEAPKVSAEKATRPSRQTPQPPEDDLSWRAAFLAGRYRSATATPPTLRRLEQRAELLSLALLLAPRASLTEILAAWRRCEEETSAAHASQQAEEEDFDDRADKRTTLPGGFTITNEQPEMVLNQKRREMGRFGGMNSTTGAAGGTPGGDAAPVSMFDLTRSAALALGRNAFPLRAGGVSRTGTEQGKVEENAESLRGDTGAEGAERVVRKRDLLANAVGGGLATGGGALASGLGWVLGATPAQER